MFGLPRGLPGGVGRGAGRGLPGPPGRHVVAVLDEGSLGRDGEGPQPVDLVGVARVVAVLGQAAVPPLPFVITL